MNVSSRNTGGFTLIELLLYVSIVGSLLIALSLFFATTADARIKSQSIAEVDQQGMLTMDRILQSIRNADAINSPAAGSTAASLSLAVQTASLSPTIFDLQAGAIQVKEGTGVTLPLTNSKVTLSDLSFKNLSRSGTPGLVQVSFTISRTNLAGRAEYTYQKTFTSSAALRQP